jgi:hypothetical protein
LSLDLDFSLDLEFDFSEFLFFSSELFFLESDRLVRHVLGQDGRVTRGLAQITFTLEIDVRVTTTDRSGKLFSSVVLVQEVMSDFLEVRQM